MRVLNERNTGISGREVSRLTGLSLRTVQVSLLNLENAGIVQRSAGNREHLFSIDRQKYLVNEIVGKIFTAETEFNNRIIKLIKNKTGASAVSIIQFGSTVKGNETMASDLDICFVYEGRMEKIEEIISGLRSSLFRLYNITLAPFYISAAGFRQLGRQGKPPVSNIIKEGKVISGKSIKELLHG
jgi:predicted nucleotidyltransferase